MFLTNNLKKQSAFQKKMLERELFIVQGSPDHLPELMDEARYPPPEENWTLWTTPRTAQPDDLIFFYLLSPLSAIVGYARITSEPFLDNDYESVWFGKSMAYYQEVRIFTNYVALFELRELFPEWHWTRRPQGSVKIPPHIKKPFLELIEFR